MSGAGCSCGGGCCDGMLDTCGCCEGVTRPTPVTAFNRPGLSQVEFRVGRHGQFRASLLAGLTAAGISSPTGTGTAVDASVLRALTTRDESDFTIALLDSWAAVLDVLTFYQERIANENLLRTALERRSILELARLVGYTPHPGAAAATRLAFELDGSESSPKRVLIPAGTRVQSQPGQNELPLTFETDDSFVARPEWSRLPARRSEMQFFDGEVIQTLYFQGASHQLDRGDRLILESGGIAFGSEPVEVRGARIVQRLVGGEPHSYTRVEVAQLDPAIPRVIPVWLAGGVHPPLSPEELRRFSQASVRELILSRSAWQAEALHALVEEKGWDLDRVAEHLQALPTPADGSTEVLNVHVLRRRAAGFGHNALMWDSLPAAQKVGEWVRVGAENFEFVPGAYTESWEGRKLATDSQGTLLPAGHLDLDAVYEGLVAGQVVLLESSLAAELPRVYRISKVEEATRADYGMSAKVTRLVLDPPEGLDAFTLRHTTVYVQSEELPLARRPLHSWVGGDRELPVEGLAIGLLPGRRVVVRGRRHEFGGVEASESRVLTDVEHRLDRGFTLLTFDRALDYRYERDSVTVNANVVDASHGETQREVLGSGDAAQPYQSFTLRQKPLTQRAAATASGVEPALEVRVGGVRWYRRPHVLAADPSGEGRSYVLEQESDGTTHVHFGGGGQPRAGRSVRQPPRAGRSARQHAAGRRLPTGQANVSAVYRTGLGVLGNLEADRLRMLMDRQLGVTGVTNPVPAVGGADPEPVERARHNAPGTVLTLERVVSLADFEDFASAFGGIAKARADQVWDGRRRVVFVTVAGEEGGDVTAGLPLYDKLLAALDQHREPFQPMLLASYTARLFHVEARLQPHPDHRASTVLDAAKVALELQFGFEPRQLGEVIAASDVIAVLQAVSGMVAVDLDRFYLHGDAPSLQSRLIAQPARRASSLAPGQSTEIKPAELLRLAPGGVELTLVADLAVAPEVPAV